MRAVGQDSPGIENNLSCPSDVGLTLTGHLIGGERAKNKALEKRKVPSVSPATLDRAKGEGMNKCSLKHHYSR
jgi:hypothetical protein